MRIINADQSEKGHPLRLWSWQVFAEQNVFGQGNLQARKAEQQQGSASLQMGCSTKAKAEAGQAHLIGDDELIPLRLQDQTGSEPS